MPISLSIFQLGQPVLRQKAQPILDVEDQDIQELIDDLMQMLMESRGVGIAAPQVGRSQRLLIIASHPNARYPHAPDMEPVAMINPSIVSHSDEIVKDWEGCLSVPGIRGLIPRYKNVEVKYTNRSGELERQVFTDFIARIFQHEYDHLEGYVFIDRVESTLEMISDAEYLKLIELGK